MGLPFLVFSDKKGNIFNHPHLRMVGARGNSFVLPKENELIRLPSKSSLFYLPGRLPLGFDPVTKRIEALRRFNGKKIFAVAATPIPAVLRIYNCAAVIEEKKTLPFWAYTACGCYGGKFYLTAKRVDKRVRQSPRFYDDREIKKRVKAFYKRHSGNKLYQHLSNCALNYNCLAAKNLFLNRWEAPIPVSRFCNSRCLGCISFKYSNCPVPHKRINFRPRIGEIVEVMVNHLKNAKEAIVSFGQGCEGEPLLEADLIAQSIGKVRRITSRGTINMNTNASIPKKMEFLCRAGMDSFRVSLNSPSEKFYNLYFKPLNYKFRDVLKSIEIAKHYKKFVSINLFVFPGFSDSNSQVNQLLKFIKNTGIDMIQWRNLNIDTRLYLDKIPHKGFKPCGILEMLEAVKKEFPHLKTGYFNLPKEKFSH